MFHESAWLVKATVFRTLLTAERRAHRVRKRAHVHTKGTQGGSSFRVAQRRGGQAPSVVPRGRRTLV